MTDRLRTGVIGTGVIAQVMHLHFLRELADRYEVVALCDISEASANACAKDYDVPEVFTDWREMLRRPLDAVLVLTSGSHAPPAVAAAQAGRHVFVEKPMCFSTAEGVEMIGAAKQAGVTLMVGYPKRYDGAFRRFKVEADQLEEKRLLRVTTTESPFLPYVRHYPLHPPANDVGSDVLAALRADSAGRLREALGTDDRFLLNEYQSVLLDTLVHEINTVRAVLGEPESLDYVDLRPGQATVLLGYGPTKAVIHWVDTPAMVRYSMEFALLAAGGRVTLTLPSPYLRNAPASLVVEGGSADSTSSWRREETVGYESGFKEELRVFYDAITAGGPVPTDGADGVRDVALCQAIIRCTQTRQPIERPTDF